MNKFEQGLGSKKEFNPYSEKVDEISYQAAEMPEFQKVVKTTKSRIETIQRVRTLLKEHFPEISELPEPLNYSEESLARGGDGRKIIRGRVFGVRASNEFKIAKNIIDLLSEK